MAIAPVLSRNSPGSTGGTKRLALALAESELRYRRLFETAHDGILILDAETGKIIDINPYLLDLLGYPFETIIGRQLWEIGVFEDIAANRAAFEKLRNEEYIRYENRPLRTSSGKEVAVEFVSNLYLVGDARVIQCNIRDIRPRSAARQDDCNDRLNALHVLGEAKDHVLAILSHELRTPLSAISSMLDLVELGHTTFGMLAQGATVPPQFDQSAIAVIRRNVANLVRLINELLDLSHFAKGTLLLNLTQVEGHEVIQLALKNLEQPQKSKQIALDLRLHAQNSNIVADGPKLEQIISNIVGNAIKFTPQGGTVLITTRNDEAGDFIIEVQDTGIGFSSDAQARIFSPFEQADASIHSRFGGLGLGLSIAHTLADLHGGSLQAASDGIGHGAKFTVRFKGAPPEFATLAGNGSASPFRILLAEDNEDARRCMTALLESAGYEVCAAAEVKSAIELAARHNFDLLVADLGLPDGTGSELLLKLRESNPTLRAIAISGYGLPQDVLKSRAAGFLAHLVKPVHFTELKNAIEPLAAAKASSLRAPAAGPG